MVGVLLGCVGLALVGCSSASSSPASSTATSAASSTVSPAPSPDRAAGSDPVRFDAGGGIRLAGRLFGSGRVIVVLAHQVDDDQSDWYPFAKRLVSLGYRALTFDLRGYCPGSG